MCYVVGFASARKKHLAIYGSPFLEKRQELEIRHVSEKNTWQAWRMSPYSRFLFEGSPQKYGGVTKWLKEADCKFVALALRGFKSLPHHHFQKSRAENGAVFLCFAQSDSGFAFALAVPVGAGEQHQRFASAEKCHLPCAR